MSELTSCNYCDLLSLKERYKGKGKVITRDSQEWIDVYVVPDGEKLDTRIDFKTGNHLSNQWKMSFMALTDYCCC